MGYAISGSYVAATKLLNQVKDDLRSIPIRG